MGSGTGGCAQTTREQAHRSGLESLPPPRRTNISTPSPAGSRQLPATLLTKAMGRQRVADSSAVPGHAGQKEASTRSHHEERVFEASQVRGAPDGWIGGTPQLPHKCSVQSDSRLDTLVRVQMWVSCPVTLMMGGMLYYDKAY